MDFYIVKLDEFKGSIVFLSPVNMISHKNPQKRLKNAIIHLFTHKLAMNYQNGANTLKMILKRH